MSDSNNTNKDEDNWGYFPSAAAAIVFLVVYSILLLAHLFQAIRYRTIWVWPLIVGVALEVVGYATRWISTNDLSKIWPIAVSQTTVIVAPAFIAAQNYMMVGRIMSFLGSDYSPLSHHLITKIFVISDFISILSQAIGGSMLSADTLNTIRVGFYILVGALGFQVFIFLVFVVITIVFDRRSRAGLGEKRNVVQPVFTAFYISATMIILRSIFRLIEFATVKFTPDAAEGYTLHHEWLLYVWDALPITVCVITLAIAHAGKYLPRTKGLRIDGTYEDPSPSRVCGCCCVYKRPRKFDVEAFQRTQQAQVQMAQADPSRSTFHSRVALVPPTKQ